MVPLPTVIFTGSVGEISWSKLGDSDTVATGFGATLDEGLEEELDDAEEPDDDCAEPAAAVAPAGLTPAVPVCAILSPEVDPEQAAVVASTPTAIRARAARRAVLER
jgi:hypothetical protein